MTTRTRRLIAHFLVAGAAACGGDDSGSGPPPAPVLTTVEISPNPVTVFMGDTIQLSATAKDQNGAVMPGKTVTWASDAPTVAAIDSLGRVIAKTSGTAMITAAVESKTASVSLTSTGPGTTGAVTGSATITPTGGSVQATLPGGGTLGLTVPSGALRSATSITLEPLIPPPGALASFRLTPAGIRLDKSATLVIKLSSGAKLRSSSTLVIEQEGVRTLIPGTLDLNQGTLTVQLSTLGLQSGAASTGTRTFALQMAADSTSTATATVSNLDSDALFNYAQQALSRFVAIGTPEEADHMQQTMARVEASGDLAQHRYTQILTDWVTKLCSFTGFAFHDLSTFGFISDYRGLERVIINAVLWERARREMNALLQSIGAFTCPASPSLQSRVSTKLATLQPLIVTDLNAFAVEPTPRDSAFIADRLRPLLDAASTLAQLAYDPEVQLLMDMIRDQVIRLRHVGFDRCHTNPANQEIQGRLARAMVVGLLPGLSLADLREDIERCGMAIVWDALDANGNTVGTGTLGIAIGSPPGQYTLNGNASLYGTGNLRLRSGFIQALLCPTPASDNNEQLEIAAGRDAGSLTRVAVLSPSGTNRYLPLSSLQIGTDTLRKAAGIAPNDTGTVTVVIRRIGGDCSGLFFLDSHRTLGTLKISFRNEIRFRFDSDLEGWIPGSFGVAEGAPPWAWTRWDYQGGKGVVNMDGRDAAADTVPNATLTRTIDLPPGVTTITYDVAAHNRPESNVRYRLLINGQVIRDAVVVGTDPPNFVYFTRTIDISAFAGQTVTVRFEQHDNGSNGVFPGSSKHLYIDNIRIR